MKTCNYQRYTLQHKIIPLRVRMGVDLYSRGYGSHITQGACEHPDKDNRAHKSTQFSHQSNCHDCKAYSQYARDVIQ